VNVSSVRSYTSTSNQGTKGAKMGVKVAVLPIVGMIMAECAQAGRMMAGKAAMSNGMSSFVFVLYSNTIASIILLPSSLIFHRSSSLSLSRQHSYYKRTVYAQLT